MKRWNRSILGWSLALTMVGAGIACGSSGDSEKDDHPDGKHDAGPSDKEPGDNDDGHEGKQPTDAGKGTGSSKPDAGSNAGKDSGAGREQPDASRGAPAPADAGVTGPTVSGSRETDDGGATTEPDPTSPENPNPGTGSSAGAPTCDTTRCELALAEAKKDPILSVIAAQATVCCNEMTNMCGGTFPGAGKCFSEQEILDGVMMLPATPPSP